MILVIYITLINIINHGSLNISCSSIFPKTISIVFPFCFSFCFISCSVVFLVQIFNISCQESEIYEKWKENLPTLLIIIQLKGSSHYCFTRNLTWHSSFGQNSLYYLLKVNAIILWKFIGFHCFPFYINMLGFKINCIFLVSVKEIYVLSVTHQRVLAEYSWGCYFCFNCLKIAFLS